MLGASTHRPLRAFASLLAVGLTCAHGTASADTASDRLLAQGLFDAGLKLMDAGHYADACPKFVESQRLDPGGGTLLNIALCHEKQGRLATATLDYDQAIAQAVKDKRTDRETFARTRLQQIAPLVPHIAITLGKGVPADAVVRIDETQVPPEAFGVPLPFNAGKHVVTATAPGRGTYSQELPLKDGETRRLEIPSLPLPDPSAAAPPSSATPPSLGGSGNAVNAGVLPPTPYERKTTSPVVPALWITGGVAFGTSLFTGTWALISWATYKADCIDGRDFCRTQEGRDAADRARLMAIVSTVTLGIGAVAWLAIPFIPSKRLVVNAGPAYVGISGKY